MLVGPVGGEGEVGGVGDRGGPGWPVSVIQHLQREAPVARPRGLAPPAENEGEYRRRPVVVGLLGTDNTKA